MKTFLYKSFLGVMLFAGLFICTQTVEAVTDTKGCYIFTKTLSTGSSGQEVTELQNRLSLEGVFKVKANGYFGPATKSAVIAYQSNNGLTKSGSVGPMTRALLNICPSTPNVLGVSTSTKPAFGKPVSGLKESQVQAIINMLRAFGADQEVIENVYQSLYR